MSKKNYPSDLSDLEWEQIKHLFAVDYRRGGRPPKYEKRQILNAIFYIARTGCQWYFLPKDFPPWQLVYSYFRKWDLLFERLNEELRKHLRELTGRHEEPSAAIIDSQSIKTTERGASKALIMAKRSKEEKDL